MLSLCVFSCLILSFNLQNSMINKQQLEGQSEDLTISFYKLFYELSNQGVSLPPISHNTSLHDVLKGLVLYGQSETSQQSSVIVKLALGYVPKLRQKGNSTLQIMNGNLEKLISLTLQYECQEVGLWLCLMVAKYFLEQKQSTYARYYFMKYQLIYLNWCDQDSINQNTMPIIQFGDQLEPEFEELYFNAVQDITTYSICLRSSSASQEMIPKKSEEHDPKLLHIWRQIWLRLLMILSASHPHSVNKFLSMNKGSELTKDAIGQLIVGLQEQGNEKILINYNSIWSIEKILDNEQEFVKSAIIDSIFEVDPEIIDCLDVYHQLCGEIPYLPKMQIKVNSQDRHSLIRDLKLLNEVLNFEIKEEFDMDYDLYKKFSISEFIFRRMYHYKEISKQNSRTHFVTFLVNVNLLRWTSEIAQLNEIHLANCCLSLYIIYITVINQTKQFAHSILLQQLKTNLEKLTKDQYRTFQTIRSSMFSGLGNILSQDFFQAYINVFDDWEFKQRKIKSDRTLHSEVKAVKIKLLILACERYDTQMNDYFQLWVDNSKEFKFSLNPILKMNFSKNPLHLSTALGGTLKEFNKILGKLQAVKKVYFQNSALTGSLFEGDKEEIATQDEEQYVILHQREKILEKLNIKVEYWEIGQSITESIEKSLQCQGKQLWLYQVNEVEEQLQVKNNSKVFLIVNCEMPVKDIVKCIENDKVIKIFINNSKIDNQLVQTKLMRCLDDQAISDGLQKESDYYQQKQTLFGQFNYSKVTGHKGKLSVFRKNLWWMLQPQNKEKACNDFIHFMELFSNNFLGSSIPKTASQKAFEQFKQDLHSKSLRKDFKIIKWYKIQSKFYQMLNRGLRILTDSMQIGYFRYPFSILFRSIQELYYRQRNLNFRQSQFKCYRGCRISVKELFWLKENIGGFIQLEGFLSTSKNKKLAVNTFSSGCLLTISVPPSQSINFTLYNNGFADISGHYSHQNEEEILFNPLNYFKIKNYQLNQDENFHEFELEYSYPENLPQQLKNHIASSQIQLNFARNQGTFFTLIHDELREKEWHFGKLRRDVEINERNFKTLYKNRYHYPLFVPVFEQLTHQSQLFHSQLEKLAQKIINKNSPPLKQIHKTKYLLVKTLFLNELKASFENNNIIYVSTTYFRPHAEINEQSQMLYQLQGIFEAVLRKGSLKIQQQFIMTNKESNQKKIFLFVIDHAVQRIRRKMAFYDQKNFNLLNIQSDHIFQLLNGENFHQIVSQDMQKLVSSLHRNTPNQRFKSSITSMAHQGEIQKELVKFKQFRENHQYVNMIFSHQKIVLFCMQSSDRSRTIECLDESEKALDVLKKSGLANDMLFSIVTISMKIGDPKRLNRYIQKYLKELEIAKKYSQYFTILKAGVESMKNCQSSEEDLIQLLHYSITNINPSEISAFSNILLRYQYLLRLINLTKFPIPLLYQSTEEKLFEKLVEQLPTLNQTSTNLVEDCYEITKIIYEYSLMDYWDKVLLLNELLQSSGVADRCLNDGDVRQRLIINCMRISGYFNSHGSLEDVMVMTEKGLSLYEKHPKQQLYLFPQIKYYKWRLLMHQIEKYWQEKQRYLEVILEKAQKLRQFQEQEQLENGGFYDKQYIEDLIPKVKELIKEKEAKSVINENVL